MLTHSSHINRAFNIETAIIKDIAKQVSVTILAHTPPPPPPPPPPHRQQARHLRCHCVGTAWIDEDSVLAGLGRQIVQGAVAQ
jgi:hypothetical protein